MNNKYIFTGLFILVLILIIIYVILRNNYEMYSNPRIDDIQKQNYPMSMPDSNEIPYNNNVLPYPQISHGYESQSDYIRNSCDGRDVLQASELLPKQNLNGWGESNPQINNGSLLDRNLLDSTALFGIDTIGSSLKNGNQQLRSDPFIEKVEVGPWSQSSIAPDTTRRNFEIGSA